MNNKKIGFNSIVLLTINSIIGTGIFLSPGNVAKMVGKMAPLIYLYAAIFACILAISFAMAAKYVSKGGAAYAYTKAAFRENLAFYVGITRFVSAAIAWGVVATAVVRTTYSIFGHNASKTDITIGFLCLMGALFLINFFGTKILTIISNISTIGKLFALLFSIIVGLIFILNSKTVPSTITFNTDYTITSIVTAVIAAFYAFTGFESVATGSTDMVEPQKNLPRAIPLAIGIIAFVYIGIIGISMTINFDALVNSNQVVVLAGVFNNRIISNIIIYGALVSMFGINVAASFHTPRILESMSKEGQILNAFSKRTRNELPYISFIVTGIIAIVIPMTFNYDMGGIIIISSMSRFIQFLIVPACVILFYFGKTKEPIHDAKKNFFLDIVIPVISLVFTILLLTKFNWVGQFTINGNINWMAIGAMIIGYVVLPFALLLLKKKK